MTDYPYEPVLLIDPVSLQRAANAQTTVYDVADTTNSTPLALKDGTGLPLSNPMTSSADAFTRPFYAPSEDIKLVGAGLTVFVSSAKGMRDAAAASAAAAQTAAANAASAVTDSLSSAVTSAQSAATSAANAAALVGAPADTAIATAINASGSATKAALSATYAGLVQLAKNPDMLIAGAVTVDSNNLVTSAAVKWPDGTPGTLTITSRDANNAVLAYNITYGAPVTKTFTQPTITRNAAGAATNVPQIVVS